jgi:hypothetical protein
MLYRPISSTGLRPLIYATLFPNACDHPMRFIKGHVLTRRSAYFLGPSDCSLSKTRKNIFRENRPLGVKDISPSQMCSSTANKIRCKLLNMCSFHCAFQGRQEGGRGKWGTCPKPPVRRAPDRPHFYIYYLLQFSSLVKVL